VSNRLNELGPREYGAWTLEETMPVRAYASGEGFTAWVFRRCRTDPGP